MILETKKIYKFNTYISVEQFPFYPFYCESCHSSLFFYEKSNLCDSNSDIMLTINVTCKNCYDPMVLYYEFDTGVNLNLVCKKMYTINL